MKRRFSGPVGRFAMAGLVFVPLAACAPRSVTPEIAVMHQASETGRSVVTQYIEAYHAQRRIDAEAARANPAAEIGLAGGCATGSTECVVTYGNLPIEPTREEEAQFQNTLAIAAGLSLYSEALFELASMDACGNVDAVLRKARNGLSGALQAASGSGAVLPLAAIEQVGGLLCRVRADNRRADMLKAVVKDADPVVMEASTFLFAVSDSLATAQLAREAERITYLKTEAELDRSNVRLLAALEASARRMNAQLQVKAVLKDLFLATYVAHRALAQALDNPDWEIQTQLSIPLPGRMAVGMPDDSLTGWAGRTVNTTLDHAFGTLYRVQQRSGHVLARVQNLNQ